MMEELRLRNPSEETIRSYIEAVKRFARHYGTSPDRMNAEQVRAYLLYLVGRAQAQLVGDSRKPGCVSLPLCTSTERVRV
ncbi:MAG: phage integrase N-terminal SAM-like domain-containing protein [Bryobacteraceae bacterium]